MLCRCMVSDETIDGDLRMRRHFLLLSTFSLLTTRIPVCQRCDIGYRGFDHNIKRDMNSSVMDDSVSGQYMPLCSLLRAISHG